MPMAPGLIFSEHLLCTVPSQDLLLSYSTGPNLALPTLLSSTGSIFKLEVCCWHDLLMRLCDFDLFRLPGNRKGRKEPWNSLPFMLVFLPVPGFAPWVEAGDSIGIN